VDELTNQLWAIGDDINSWKTTYDVESLEVAHFGGTLTTFDGVR